MSRLNFSVNAIKAWWFSVKDQPEPKFNKSLEFESAFSGFSLNLYENSNIFFKFLKFNQEEINFSSQIVTKMSHSVYPIPLKLYCLRETFTPKYTLTHTNTLTHTYTHTHSLTHSHTHSLPKHIRHTFRDAHTQAHQHKHTQTHKH